MRETSHFFHQFSRKSQAEDLLILIITVIVIIGIILVFSYNNINKTKIKKEKLALEINNQESGQLLINYLRSQLRFKNVEDLAVSEAISTFLSNEDEDLWMAIEQKSNEFFSKSSLESDKTSWSLIIAYNNKQFVLQSAAAKKRLLSIKEMSKISSPHYGSNPIEIRLFLVQIKA